MQIKIEVLKQAFSVCRVQTLDADILKSPFCFAAKTDEELSLVCETAQVPAHVLESVHGWRAFRVAGVLDFSIIGLLARLTAILAKAKISVFAVSTFNTDYILVQNADLDRAMQAFADAGCQIQGWAPPVLQGCAQGMCKQAVTRDSAADAACKKAVEI